MSHLPDQLLDLLRVFLDLETLCRLDTPISDQQLRIIFLALLRNIIAFTSPASRRLVACYRWCGIRKLALTGVNQRIDGDLSEDPVLVLSHLADIDNQSAQYWEFFVLEGYGNIPDCWLRELVFGMSSKLIIFEMNKAYWLSDTVLKLLGEKCPKMTSLKLWGWMWTSAMRECRR